MPDVTYAHTVSPGKGKLQRGSIPRPVLIIMRFGTLRNCNRNGGAHAFVPALPGMVPDVIMRYLDCQELYFVHIGRW